MSLSWHSDPAAIIEDYLQQKNTPLDWKDLVEIAQQLDYGVRLIARELLNSAFTDHSRRGIIIPTGDADRMRRQLLHELTETLLRSPIAAEYCYTLTNHDEYHEVACLVVRQY